MLIAGQAAYELGGHPRAVRRRLVAGEIPVTRAGRLIRIERAVLRPDATRIANLARESVARVA
jgi:hypothetical protein